MIVNQATDDLVELNPVESGGDIFNEIQQPSPDFVDTIIHIGDSGDSFFQEVVAVSTTLTPPQDVVNNFSYEKMDEEEEIEKMGNLAPLYVEVSHDFPLSVRIRLSPAQPPPLSCYLHILSLHLSFLSRPSHSLCVDISSTSRLLLLIIVDNKKPCRLNHQKMNMMKKHHRYKE